MGYSDQADDQPLFSLPPLRLPPPAPEAHPGSLTPPLHTLQASIPFMWEEHPGKPLSSSTAAPPLPSAVNDTAAVKCLELPPRLLNDAAAKSTKTPSPTTVLVGPDNSRFLRRGPGSFDGSLTLGPTDRGLFGSWRKRRAFGSKGKSVVQGGNFVFSNFSDDGDGSCDGGATVKVTRMSRKGSRMLSLSHTPSHFWATIYGALKQVISRRSAK